MKRTVTVMLVAVMSFGAVSLAVADTNVQQVKEKNLAKNVKEIGAKAKMMPEPDVQLKRLTTGLDLTKEQQKQIRPMLVAEYDKLKTIRNDDNLSPKQIQVKVEALRTATIAQMQTVLTAEQKVTLDMISKEIKSNKQKRMQANRKTRIGTKSDPPQQVVK